MESIVAQKRLDCTYETLTKMICLGYTYEMPTKEKSLHPLIILLCILPLYGPKKEARKSKMRRR